MVEDRRAIVGAVEKRVKRVTNASPRYFDGGKRSIARLKALNFDPITKLVELYERLQQEEKYWSDIRDGRKVQILSDGKVLKYNTDAHSNATNLLVSISEKLLRYNYGRVPETAPEAPKTMQPLVINLGKPGDTFTINEQAEPLEGEWEDDSTEDA